MNGWGFRFAWRIAQKACLPDFAESEPREKREVVVACLHEEMIRQTEAIPGAKTLVMGTNYSDFLGGREQCGMAGLRHGGA